MQTIAAYVPPAPRAHGHLTREDHQELGRYWAQLFLHVNANPDWRALHDRVVSYCMQVGPCVRMHGPMQHFTCHDFPHMQTVLGLAGLMLERWELWSFAENRMPNPDSRSLRLVPEDILVLLLCCYLHDTRMSYGVREEHEELDVALLIRDLRMSQELAMRVQRVSRLHSSKKDSVLQRERDPRTRLLGALLRVADCLDCTFRRVKGCREIFEVLALTEKQRDANRWQAQLDSVDVHADGVEVSGRQKWDEDHRPHGHAGGGPAWSLEDRAREELGAKEFVKCEPLLRPHVRRVLNLEVKAPQDWYTKGTSAEIFQTVTRFCREVQSAAELRELLDEPAERRRWFGRVFWCPGRTATVGWRAFQKHLKKDFGPDPADLVNHDRPHRILLGPPGSGKSVLLVRALLKFLGQKKGRKALLIQKDSVDVALRGAAEVAEEFGLDGNWIVALDGVEAATSQALSAAWSHLPGTAAHWLMVGRSELEVRVTGCWDWDRLGAGPPPPNALTSDSAEPGLEVPGLQVQGTERFYSEWLESLLRLPKARLTLRLFAEAGPGGLPRDLFTGEWRELLLMAEPGLRSVEMHPQWLTLVPTVRDLMSQDDRLKGRLFYDVRDRYPEWRDALVASWRDDLAASRSRERARILGPTFIALNRAREYMLVDSLVEGTLPEIPGRDLAAQWWTQMQREGGWSQTFDTLAHIQQELLILAVSGRWADVLATNLPTPKEPGIRLPLQLVRALALYFLGKKPDAHEELTALLAAPEIGAASEFRVRAELDWSLVCMDLRNEDPREIEARLRRHCESEGLARHLRGYARMLLVRLLREKPLRPLEFCRLLDESKADVMAGGSLFEESRFLNFAADTYSHLYFLGRAKSCLEEDARFKKVLLDPLGRATHLGVQGNYLRRIRSLEEAEECYREDVSLLPLAYTGMRKHVLIKQAETLMDLGRAARLEHGDEAKWWTQASVILDQAASLIGDPPEADFFYCKAILKWRLAMGERLEPDWSRTVSAVEEHRAAPRLTWYERGFAHRLAARVQLQGTGLDLDDAAPGAAVSPPPATEEALRALNESIASFGCYPPEQAVSYWYSARALVGLGRWEEARVQVQRAWRSLQEMADSTLDEGFRALLDRLRTPALLQGSSTDAADWIDALARDVALLEY